MKILDPLYNALVHRIYDINEKDFEGVAMEVWKFQYENNLVYHTYCNLLGTGIADVKSLLDIPYLPISAFKSHIIKTGKWDSSAIFQSSGTTDSIQSQHHVRDLSWYHRNASNGFQRQFASSGEFVWLGLLPAYLDRPDSSLVDMVNSFMSASGHQENGFFPIINKALIDRLQHLCHQNIKVVLIGVTFALLDLFEQFEVPVWENLLIIETGGMKGRGKELTREEVHARLRNKHAQLRIASEYGMTELLSQAYSTNDYFIPAPQMFVSIRDISDPLSSAGFNQRGAINIIDLANVDSCAFIATEDVGIVYSDGSFNVLGRLDNSDLRGCNLLYT